MRLTWICISLAALIPAVAQARPDTRTMTCAQAAGLVQSQGAAVLQTSPRRYDRYLATRSCFPRGGDAVAQFAPTLDHPRCFIGYVCKARIRDISPER